MRTLAVLPSLLAVLLIASPPGGGQESSGIKNLCPFCKTTGKVPNPFLEKLQELERNTIYCSWCIENDQKGLGMPWLPCEDCRNAKLKAKAVEEFEKATAERFEWLAERREIDRYLKVKEPLLHLRTEHFVWAWDIPKVKAGNKVYRDHEALHLYAERMEEYYAEFQRVHGIEDLDNINNLHAIYAFDRARTGIPATGKYAMTPSTSGSAIHVGVPSSYVTTWDRSKRPTDWEFHNNLIHVVTHLLTGAYRTGYWSYPTGIAYEGIAHWWEMAWHKRATTYCTREQDGTLNWVAKGWREKVRKQVLAGRQPPLADLLVKDAGSLEADEHYLAWSYMDFMMSMDPHKTILFIAALKAKKPAREAFLNVWELSVLGFEEQWEQYVKTQYALKDTVPPKVKVIGVDSKK